jgi:putative DNA primase/helicase
VVDTTTEKIARILGENPGGLICFRDELAGLLGGFDRYGGNGTDRAFWIESHGGRPHRYERVSLDNTIDIPFCAVSLIGGIQPDRLNSLLLSGDDDGLASRMIFAWPDPVPPKRPKQTVTNGDLEAALQRLADLRFDHRDGNEHPRTIFLEPDAADEFQSWWERVQWDAKMNAVGRLAGAVGKLDGIALRLAMVIEFLDWAWGKSVCEPTSISVRSVVNALALIDEWARANLERVFAEAALPQAQRDAMVIARWLLKTRPAMINARAIARQSGFPGPRDYKALDEALEFLESAGWLSPIGRAGAAGGRPRKDYAVNPAIYGGQP